VYAAQAEGVELRRDDVVDERLVDERLVETVGEGDVRVTRGDALTK
jgi:hypothetical protein